MSMSKEEIGRWLDTLPAGAEIGVDEGGLALQVSGEDAYLEIGGLEDDEEPEWCECGRAWDDCATRDGSEEHLDREGR